MLGGLEVLIMAGSRYADSYLGSVVGVDLPLSTLDDDCDSVSGSAVIILVLLGFFSRSFFFLGDGIVWFSVCVWFLCVYQVFLCTRDVFLCVRDRFLMFAIYAY